MHVSDDRISWNYNYIKAVDLKCILLGFKSRIIPRLTNILVHEKVDEIYISNKKLMELKNTAESKDVIKFLQRQRKQTTLAFTFFLVVFLQKQMRLSHKVHKNFNETQIVLVKNLMELSSIVKPTLIMILYNFMSLQFTFKEKNIERLHRRNQPTPMFDIIHALLPLFELANGEMKYVVEYRTQEIKQDIKLPSLEELYLSGEVKYSIDFYYYLHRELLVPLLQNRGKDDYNILYNDSVPEGITTKLYNASNYGDNALMHLYNRRLNRMQLNAYDGSLFSDASLSATDDNNEYSITQSASKHPYYFLWHQHVFGNLSGTTIMRVDHYSSSVTEYLRANTCLTMNISGKHNNLAKVVWYPNGIKIVPPLFLYCLNVEMLLSAIYGDGFSDSRTQTGLAFECFDEISLATFQLALQMQLQIKSIVNKGRVSVPKNQIQVAAQAYSTCAAFDYKWKVFEEAGHASSDKTLKLNACKINEYIISNRITDGLSIYIEDKNYCTICCTYHSFLQTHMNGFLCGKCNKLFKGHYSHACDGGKTLRCNECLIYTGSVAHATHIEDHKGLINLTRDEFAADELLLIIN